MPPLFPYSQPYEPVKKPTNWPVIILITIAVIVVIIAAYFIIDALGKRGDNLNNSEGTVPAGSGTYNCDTDTYNCADFSTQAEAQEVFDYCNELGFGDIHQLDNDNDGEVCESLP